MYKVIENSYDGKSTFVFKFNKEIYAINGCTMYNHSNKKTKEHVRIKFNVGDFYMCGIDDIISELKSDITREELFYIMSDNSYDLLCMNNNEYLVLGLEDIRCWYTEDVRIVARHVNLGGYHFRKIVMNHPMLNTLREFEVTRLLHNLVTKSGTTMDSLKDLNNVFDCLHKFYDDQYVNVSIKNFIIDVFMTGYNMRSNVNVELLVKYSRENNSDDVVYCIYDVIKNAIRSNPSSLSDIIHDGWFEMELSEEEYIKLINMLVTYIINCGVVSEAVEGFYKNSSPLVSPIKNNPALKKEFDALLDEYHERSKHVMFSIMRELV